MRRTAFLIAIGLIVALACVKKKSSDDDGADNVAAPPGGAYAPTDIALDSPAS